MADSLNSCSNNAPFFFWLYNKIVIRNNYKPDRKRYDSVIIEVYHYANKIL